MPDPAMVQAILAKVPGGSQGSFLCFHMVCCEEKRERGTKISAKQEHSSGVLCLSVWLPFCLLSASPGHPLSLSPSLALHPSGNDPHQLGDLPTLVCLFLP